MKKPTVSGSLARTLSATSSRARRKAASSPFLARMTAVIVSIQILNRRGVSGDITMRPCAWEAA
jgi:hypothetical protein